MTIQILKPPDPAKVKAQAICAQGTATSGGSGSVVVKAKIYSGHQGSWPATPPMDAIVGTAGTNFAFSSISGATGSDNPPYPDNTLVVWASYPADPNSFESNFTFFGGKNSLKTDCET